MTGAARAEADGGEPTASVAESWELVLTHMEAEIEAAERALAAEAPELTTDYVPPHGLGPPPPHLRERAQLLHDRCRATADALTRATASVAGELRSLNTGSGSRPTPAFVDSRC